MKKTLITLLLLFVVFMAVLVSCKSEPDEKEMLQGLYGTWIEEESTTSQWKITFSSDGRFELGLVSDPNFKESGSYVATKSGWSTSSGSYEMSFKIEITYDNDKFDDGYPSNQHKYNYYTDDQTLYYSGTRYQNYSMLKKFVKEIN